jgi:DNA-binding NarL/FixJ family response regulator
VEWQLLARLRTAATAVPVVALVDAGTVRHGVEAIRAGARSVLPRDVAADVLRRAVDVTMDGQTVLPAAAASLLAVAGLGAAADAVPADRIGWLRLLASGGTVAELAAQAGYSERAMFRLLRDLYREMGARNRVEAIMLARDRGWV